MAKRQKTAGELFRTNLAKMMGEREITQKQLAAKLGAKQPYISHILGGYKSVSFQQLDVLAKSLSVRVKDFFQEG